MRDMYLKAKLPVNQGEAADSFLYLHLRTSFIQTSLTKSVNIVRKGQ